MFKKIFCLILILKLTQARYIFVPKFYGKDSAVIVDTGKSSEQIKNAVVNYRNKIIMPPPFPLWRHYPRYHIVPAPPPGQILSINSWGKAANTGTMAIPKTKSTSTTSTPTSSSTTTTSKPTIQSTTMAMPKYSSASPLLADGEFPRELLDIAQKKLGLNNLDEIPSLSELGQLLGTESSEETLKYIKQLTSNEKGIDLLKAYIESSDYTDNTGDLNKNYDAAEDEDEDEDEDELDNIEQPPLKVKDEGLIVVTDEGSNDDYEIINNDKEESPEEVPQSFMGRIANYMHLNSLFHKNKETEENLEYHQLNKIAEGDKKVSNNEMRNEADVNRNLEAIENVKTPILVRDAIPFNYPVPIRIQTTVHPSTTLPPSYISASPRTTVTHLNTPKILIPHVQKIARITKIPSKKIEDFLASKPKLLELVTKVSRFPISYDRNSPIEAQIMTVVQKAFEQDDDLQKLLSSTATLK